MEDAGWLDRWPMPHGRSLRPKSLTPIRERDSGKGSLALKATKDVCFTQLTDD